MCIFWFIQKLFLPFSVDIHIRDISTSTPTDLLHSDVALPTRAYSVVGWQSRGKQTDTKKMIKKSNSIITTCGK